MVIRQSPVPSPQPSAPSLQKVDTRWVFTPWMLWVLCLPMASGVACADPSLSIGTSKSAYYRYELVSIYADLFDDTYAEPASLEVRASVLRGDSVVTTCGGMTSIPLRYVEGTGRWEGYFPVPWNPPLGRYAVAVTAWASDSSWTQTAVASFEILGRRPPEIRPGFSAMTIESTVDVSLKRFPNPMDREGERWTVAQWAELLGADAVWYSVGQTMEGFEGVSDESPWHRPNLKTFPKLAEQAHRGGLKFGGWIGSYFLWGKNLRRLNYRYSTDYRKGKLFHPHRASVTDEKRFQDILALMRRLDADPNVDYIGLDYIRTGFGGYEMADEFVRKMSVDVPEGFADRTEPQRALWLAQQIEVEQDSTVVSRWEWWRAHKVATIVHRLIESSGTEKPVWLFMLGWEHGRQHGQDPLMFNDAGAAMLAVMLYESDATNCAFLTRRWAEYVRRGQVNLVLGQSVDWDLLQRSTDPPGPAEFYRRLSEGIDGVYRDGPAEGAFWHDLHRAAWGRRGPYTRLEWAMVGAAAFSKVRALHGRLPVRIDLEIAAEVPAGGSFDAEIRVRADGGSVSGLELRIYGVGVEIAAEDTIYVGDLEEGDLFSLLIPCRLRADGRGASMVAVEGVWAPAAPQDKFVTFGYVTRAATPRGYIPVGH